MHYNSYGGGGILKEIIKMPSCICFLPCQWLQDLWQNSVQQIPQVKSAVLQQKSVAMQDESLHYSVTEGWTEPVRSSSPFLCQSWLVTYCTCISVPTRLVLNDPWCGFPPYTAWRTIQKVYKCILQLFVLLSALNFLPWFHLSLHVNTASYFI